MLRALHPELAGMAAELESRRDASIWRLRGELEGRNVPESLWGGELLLRWRWYQGRIDALRNTVADTETCGELMERLVCADCGWSCEVPQRCGQTLLCAVCRDIELRRRRELWGSQMAAALAAAPRHHRARMVTLTVPHAGTLEERLTAGCRARGTMLAALRRYLASIGERSAWWASLEVTAGDDGEGHVHWHVALVGPFVPDALVAVWWAEALRRHGMPVDARPLGEALERLGKFGRPSSAARRELARYASVPWTVAGVRAPRRRSGESSADYAARRVRWAAELGGRPRRVSTVAGRLRAPLLQIVRAVAQHATVPHAVVDVRAATTKGSEPVVTELCKYAVKAWDMPAPMHARVWVALKRGRLRRAQSSMGRRTDSGAGCPVCGSPHVRPQRDPDPQAATELAVMLARGPPSSRIRTYTDSPASSLTAAC